MLELIRQYAGERLAGSGEAAETRERHAAWCAELAAASAGFGGADHAGLVRRLVAEAADLRAAMVWCLGDGHEPQQALRIASPLRSVEPPDPAADRGPRFPLDPLAVQSVEVGGDALMQLVHAVRDPVRCHQQV
jgi:hypothetical protein